MDNVTNALQQSQYACDRAALTIRKLQVLYNTCRVRNNYILDKMNMSEFNQINYQDNSEMLDAVCRVRKDMLICMLFLLVAVTTVLAIACGKSSQKHYSYLPQSERPR